MWLIILVELDVVEDDGKSFIKFLVVVVDSYLLGWALAVVETRSTEGGSVVVVLVVVVGTIVSLCLNG